MSSQLRVGAIVLNTDCSCVALVKRSASNLWGFPRGSCNGKNQPEAAKQAFRTETGVVLTDPFRKVTFQVGLSSVTAYHGRADILLVIL